MYDIFYIGKKDSQFEKLKEKYITIKNVDSFETAQKKCFTKFFWCVWDDIIVNDEFVFDYIPDDYSQDVAHVFKNNESYDGVWLVPRKCSITTREVNHRFLVRKKEIDTIASIPKLYDSFLIDSWEEYEYAMTNSTTEMFYAIPRQVEAINMPRIYFPHDDQYNRKENHTFKNICNREEKYNGIFLFSKHKTVSKKELIFRHILSRKEWDIVASKHKPYDVVFISYNEENADTNYTKLLKRCPDAKRVHGVKGIHQAHIAAAKLCESEMVWIIDADAVLMDDFNFDLYIEKWDRETVHVWRSKNPINDLVYGYGGVKLFPRDLTINMDTSKPDMTTSITNKFKAVQSVSNITAFNTDPFNTWKSAFRECCKLSSKVIDRQKSKETEERLDIWCTVGADKPYGEYAILGAKEGREYGANNKDSIDALKKINDFDWLQERFNNANI